MSQASLTECLTDGFSFFKLPLDDDFINDFIDELVPQFRDTTVMRNVTQNYRTDVPVQIDRLPAKWKARIDKIVDENVDDLATAEMIKQFEWSAHSMREGDYFEIHDDSDDFGMFEMLIWITFGEGHKGRHFLYGTGHTVANKERCQPKTGDALLFSITGKEHTHGTTPFESKYGTCITLTGGVDVVRNGPDGDHDANFFKSDVRL